MRTGRKREDARISEAQRVETGNYAWRGAGTGLDRWDGNAIDDRGRAGRRRYKASKWVRTM